MQPSYHVQANLNDFDRDLLAALIQAQREQDGPDQVYELTLNKNFETEVDVPSKW